MAWILMFAGMCSGFALGMAFGIVRRGTANFWFRMYLGERRNVDRLKRQLHEAEHVRYDAMYRLPPTSERVVGADRSLAG